MKRILLSVLMISVVQLAAAGKYFGTDLCAFPQYECVKVERGQNWEKMFPDPKQRDLVQRLNRSYNAIWYGKTIVVPNNLDKLTIFDISPFPLKLDNSKEKLIVVDQDLLAWGAYDKNGRLVNWGPIASGRDRCVDAPKSCLTLTGVFRMFSKENENCRSNTYDNARMPYCMYFHKGFALHGSNDIPGRRASHGCVRMFTQDAKWLNQNFVELSNEGNDHLGTKVIVRPIRED